MNQLTFNDNSPCGDSIAMAEQELAAFFSAVTELFGSEQAELSAHEWLRELVAANDLPTSTGDWRKLTVKSLARLARRVNPLNAGGPPRRMKAQPGTECWEAAI